MINISHGLSWSRAQGTKWICRLCYVYSILSRFPQAGGFTINPRRSNF